MSKEKIQQNLLMARKYIDEAYKLAKQGTDEEIYLNPIELLFTKDEIENCGWSSSHC